jgi:hypothetical protein
LIVFYDFIQNKMVVIGIEPTTNGLLDQRSTN